VTPAISVEHVSKRFGRQTVLDDVTLSVPEGVVFALLGENGAGKSTLIRGLLGFHRFEKGQALVCGIDPRRDPLKLRRQVWLSVKPVKAWWMTIPTCRWMLQRKYVRDFQNTNWNHLASSYQVSKDKLLTRIADLEKQQVLGQSGN
jgi:ABC-2 type transport system ATP-binding protein